jgi:glucose-1-phosphatase
VLAISGNDHNAVLTRIRPTSDVIGWRDVTEEHTAADKVAAEQASADKAAADKAAADKADAAMWADKLKQWEEEDRAAEAAAEKAASDKTAAAKPAVASDALAH